MGDKTPSTGWYRLGSALLWAAGQWAVCWFITIDTLWTTLGAMFSALVAGWTTATFLGRFAKWGAPPGLMMGLGVVLGVAVFSGAVSGIETLLSLWREKTVNIDWDKLQAFLLSWAVAPPAVLGLFTGLYVRAKIPVGGGGGKGRRK